MKEKSFFFFKDIFPHLQLCVGAKVKDVMGACKTWPAVMNYSDVTNSIYIITWQLPERGRWDDYFIFLYSFFLA